MKKTLFYLLLIFFAINCQKLQAQHNLSGSYTWPSEPEVVEKLAEWQDLKFGMIVHWGLYSQLGITESWPLCSEEEEWIRRDSTMAYEDFKHWYWSAIDKFKPENFDPLQWARAGKKAGMNYLVFTTKHHDGFCMFDTKYTDFSIKYGAFKDDSRSNIAKEVFNAFRNEGYMIGAYFSKPDWHSQYYWWDRYATPTRNNNYSIEKNPWRWDMFKDFVYNQIEELVNGDYGNIDILWLDGGWVGKGDQEINMPGVAGMVRTYQPGMLIVDRTVPGKYENYQTPEQGIPRTQLKHPWESCITLGNDWGFVPNDKYKSPARVIHSLVEIVAKGGSLLLGIGPKPDGTLPDEVVSRLGKIGEWTTRNGQAIYNTRITRYYNDDNVWFTESKDGGKIYAIVCLEEGKGIPEKIVWRANKPKRNSDIKLLHTNQNVSWRTIANGIEITVPSGLPSNLPALAFSYEM